MPLQRIIRLAVSLLILLALLAPLTGLVRYPFLQQLENWTYDARLNLTLPRGIDDRVVIVDIDEASLARVGRFPWPRYRLAELTDRLFNDYQVATLGYDILFGEPDRSSGVDTLQQLARGPLAGDATYRKALEQLLPRLDYDQRFAQSLEGRPVVLGYYFKSRLEEGSSGNTGQLPPPISRVEPEWLQRLPLSQAVGYSANLPRLQQAARDGGFFDNPFVDEDGVFRRVPMIQAYDNALYGALSLVTARLALGNPEIELQIAQEGEQSYYALENIRLGSQTIPVDKHSAVYVPYRGPRGSFPYVSAWKVLDGSADRKLLRGRIVLVGTSAPGLLDLRSTPVEKVFPGVEVHANIISGILDGRIRHHPAWTTGFEFLQLLLVAVLLTIALTWLSPLAATLATIAMTLLVVGLSMAAWSSNLILPLASTLLLIALLFVFHMTWGFFAESRGKRQLAQMFGQYIPPELVDEMSESGHEFSLEGESREMTVLFSDVRGFTSISEGLDPKQLTRLMNALLTPLTRVIHQHRGTIDKYMGDAIMAFWGAPLPDSDHARHALYAAFDMMQALKDLQPEFRSQGWPEIHIGIGLNTGSMNVGNMGSEFRVAYTVLGDAVNLGSRLEGLTKAYGVDIIVSESTREQIPEFLFRELDLVRVKGKREPVAIFEPIGHKNDVDEARRAELSAWRRGLRAFRHQDWDAAEVEFFNLERQYPERQLYRIYLERITLYRQSPPGDGWDGVFTHTSK